MATTDRITEPSSLQALQEGPGSAEEVLSSGGEGSGGLETGEGVAQLGGIPALSKPTPNSARPQLVQLGSNSGQTSSAGHHPKRFSAVNITKKFLEKNSSPSTSTPILQGSVAAKPGGHSARLQTQVAPSYSRLVTTKLTSASSVSSTSGVGWSRPSSTAPSNHAGSHSPTNESQALPSGNASTTPGMSQLPQASKAIQPQPQTAVLGPGLSSKNTTGERSNKPVWGHSRQTTALKPPDARHDFPTAAEVAHGIPSKERESRQNAGSIALIKQARMEEADTFRGVHLDPNAHHWDEMEEDDDNFLDGVIEFGDGRQYKIEPTDPVESSLSSDSLPSEVKSTVDGAIPSEDSPPPVSKKERFLDDFDRTWPRSATSPSSKKDISLPTSQPPVSPTTRGPRPLHETSRVLFNERSNRLEPYSTAQRPPSGQHRAYQETTVSPTDSRNFRDALGASHPHNNTHPPHKSGSSDTQSQKFSGASSGMPSGQHNREREPLARWDGPPPSPLMPRDKEFHPEMGRRSDMGPPPIPSQAMRGHPRDGAPPPPHMSPPLTGRLSSRHPRSQKVPTLSTSDLIRFPQSPASSHASLTLVSPVTAATALPLMSAPELDGVQKDVMQSAAARAKQRRQQEEEEREKEKERARRKAAEIEERINAQQALTKSVVEQDDAKGITPSEEVVQPVEGSSHTAPQLTLPSTVPATSRPPPLQSPTRASPSDHHHRSSTSAPALPSAMRTDSWRSKTGLLSPSSPSQASQAPAMTAPLIESSALDPLASFACGPDEDLEVVEYSDMGRFVGGPVTLEPAAVEEQHVNSGPPNTTVRDEEISTSASSITPTPGTNGIAIDLSSETDWPKNHYPPVLTSESTTTTSKEALTSMVASSHFVKTLRNHNEAAISALDDAMSRIKGAINGIQAAETGKEMLSLPVVDIETSTLKATFTQGTGGSNPMQARWIPPALRFPNIHPDPRETFDVTGMEPPQSPRPAWKSVVHLPTLSPCLEPVSKKQLSLFMKPPSPVRWDILSFDPPVERMNRRDLSLNDVLFGKPLVVGNPSHRGKGRYRVSLPRSRTTFRMNPGHHALKLNNVGAFGRPTGADGVTTWRKSTPTATESFATLKEDTGAGTSSSSPSASRSESSAASQPVEHPTPMNKANGQGLSARYRTQPKMPLGSSVAFYRDSRIDAVEEELGSSVNFIVTSELESSEESAIIPEQKSTPASPTESDSALNANPLSTRTADATEHIPPLIHTKTENKGSDDLSGALLITPPTHHLANWARNALSIPVKESPVRVPDPEHLKAVWSQTSNKAGLHAVNSLEGIADDLTAIPFTIQEVKSEDGETPPPSVPAPPSRMSLHDVTRAFQQVPASSSSSSSTPHRTPSTVTPPMTRPSTYTYGNPIRPTYPYPSPMMSHSLPSNAMYPHPMPASPIPGRMAINGHAPMYTQPMWMPLAAPAPQNHGNMMRPMASPYPAQLMPYPSSGTPGLYGSQPPQNMQGSQQQQPGGQINRDRPISMMSPAIPHAGPALYGSPVLMHAPLMQVPQNHTYMVPTSRPVRTENGQLGIQQHSQQSINHETPNYNPVAPFARPTW